jgi:MFS family permease
VVVGSGEFAVALVQAATTLPVFLLVVPAGALGDIFDRRRLLLTGQLMMLLGAAGLAALTAGELTTPVLLLLIALMGIGQALCVPSFQAIQPELVARDEIPQAALLNGANANVARAVGPALGGVLIAAIGPAATFAFNALSFLGVLVVLYRWDRPLDHRPLGVERVGAAIRAGVRYVRSAPRFATVLARSALFMTFAGGLWALLPAIARGPLRLGPDGYGLLLGSVGLGAVGGAFLVPRVRALVGANVVVTGGMFGYAIAVTRLEPDADAGPVLVVAEWPVPPADAEAFVRAMRKVGRARRRTGATWWALFQDVEDPTLFLEIFIVRTWHGHLRQHDERGTVLDRELEARVRGMVVDGEEPQVRHLILAPRS